MVAGAGAIGCWLGARLVTAGHDVVLLGRARLAEGVARQGLEVHGHTRFQGRPPVVTDAAAARSLAPDGYDGIFVTCKAHATAAMADQLEGLPGCEGFVASVQNGIGNDRVLARVTPRVALVLSSHGAMMEGPASVHHTGHGSTVVAPGGVGQEAGPSAVWAADQVHDLLCGAGLEAQRSDDGLGACWTKAAVNAAINPLGAVHGQPNGLVLRDHWDEARELAKEVFALSRAAGVRLQADPVEAARGTMERTSVNLCSMLQDVAHHRPTEIEQITGYFVRAARRLGFPLARNEAVYRQVLELEASYLGEDAVLARARQASIDFALP